MRPQRRSYAGEEKSPPRESAEERGLAAAARLAAAVAAATGGRDLGGRSDAKFRLRRHSTIGCEAREARPLQAWKDPPERHPERHPERRPEPRREPQDRPERRARDVSPPARRLTRAQSARRPARLEAPARARSADPRRRYEAAFVPEVAEDSDDLQ